MARAKVAVDVEGLPELIRKLRTMPDELARKKLDRAVAAGAEVIREFQEALAPRGEGIPHAAEFIRAAPGSSRQGQFRRRYDVGPTGPGFYLTFHETGTLYLAAQPFMRPALEAGEGEALRAVAGELRRGVLTIARRG